MLKKIKSIPVNKMIEGFESGIVIGEGTFDDLRLLEQLQLSHRDDYHLFFLQEKGETSIEIDFQKI